MRLVVFSLLCIDEAVLRRGVKLFALLCCLVLGYGEGVTDFLLPDCLVCRDDDASYSTASGSTIIHSSPSSSISVSFVDFPLLCNRRSLTLDIESR